MTRYRKKPHSPKIFLLYYPRKRKVEKIFGQSRHYADKKMAFRYLNNLLHDFPIKIVQEGDKIYIIYYGDIKVRLTVTELLSYYYRPKFIFKKFLEYTFFRPNDFAKWFAEFVAANDRLKLINYHYKNLEFLRELKNMYSKLVPLLEKSNPGTIMLINIMWHQNKENVDHFLNDRF